MSSPEATSMTSLYPINREWLVSVCGGRTPVLQGSCQHVVLSGWAWLLLLFLPPSPRSCFTEQSTPLHCIFTASNTGALFCDGFWLQSYSEWKSLEESTSERRVLEVSKPLNAALPFNSSVTLKSITNTKETDMATPSSILSWKTQGQRSLVGRSPWVTGAGPVWTNLACMQARILSWSSSQIWEITVVFHRTTVWINKSILQEA